eukprot:COSAG05_NODE_1559_length_4564_cov_2.602240_8_plen_72_part_00
MMSMISFSIAVIFAAFVSEPFTLVCNSYWGVKQGVWASLHEYFHGNEIRRLIHMRFTHFSSQPAVIAGSPS